MRRTLLVASLILVSCSAEEAPPLERAKFGTIVGEVFIENPDRTSVGGAIVEIRGSSARVISKADKQFVLGSIPLGTHTLSITAPETGHAIRLPVTIGAEFQTVYLPPEDTTLQSSATLVGTVSTGGATDAGVTVYLVGGNSQQVVITGDDGSYRLPFLPQGDAQVGYSKTGFETEVLSTTIAAGDNSADLVTLSPSGQGGLRLSGIARLANATDHRGIAVLLNDGEEVTTTGEDGSYSFNGLNPGAYVLRAERDGYRSATLTGVGLTSNGSVYGLVDLSLAPGNDPEARSAADLNFNVSVINPVSGTQFEEGESISFLADVSIDGEVIPSSRIAWTAEPQAGGTVTALGSGNPISTTTLTTGDYLITATATSAEGIQASGQALVFVRPVSVDVVVTSHAPNDEILGTVPVILSATIGVRSDIVVAPNDVVWSYRESGTADPFVEVARGRSVVATFDNLPNPIIAELQVAVTVAGVTAVDSVDVFLTPIDPRPLIGQEFSAYGLQPPEPTLVTDGSGNVTRVDYTIVEGQPVLLRATENPDLVDSVSWSSDSGYLFTGADANLGILPVGVHTFTLSIAGADGEVGSIAVQVTVDPFVFTVTVVSPVAPVDSPPDYFVTTGLPLEVTITHPFQQSFPPNAIKWSDTRLGQVAIGKKTTTYLIPPGSGVIRADVTDAVGNVVSVPRTFTLQEVLFEAYYLPADPINVLENSGAGDWPIRLSLDADHSLVADANLMVTYFSSIQGLLSDVDGRFEFTVDEVKPGATVPRPFFDSLVPGVHQITAIVSDGSNFAEATRQVTVRSPSLNANLITPANETVYFATDPVVFSAQVSNDPQVAPLFSWYLDGVELDPAWDQDGTPYGSDPTDAAARADVTLPVYDPASAFYIDSGQNRFDPSVPHTIQFFARLQEVEDLGLGCVNVPGKAVCETRTVRFAATNSDVCNIDTSIQAGETVQWSGVMRMSCIVYVDGGTLNVAPGSRILLPDNSNNRIEVRAGTLNIGQNGQDSVIFESQATGYGPASNAGAWWGIRLNTGASQDATLNIENTVFRHTTQTFEGFSTNWGVGSDVINLSNVTIDGTQRAFLDLCPDNRPGVFTVENLLIKNTTGAAIWERYANGCSPTERHYSDITFENIDYGMSLDRVPEIYIDDVRFLGVSKGTAIYYNQEDVASHMTVTNCTFENIAGNAISNESATNNCTSLTAIDNTFRTIGNAAISSWNCDEEVEPDTPRLVVLGNHFEAALVAIKDNQPAVSGVEIHLNSFVNNATNIEVGDIGVDVQAQGNYLGPQADTASSGGAILALPPGRLAGVPRITDYFDDLNRKRVVRFANTLPAPIATAAEYPVAYIREPQRTQPYNADRCVPLVADSPLEGIDTAADCRWYVGVTGSETEVFPDADGCLDTTAFSLTEGVHRIVLECDKKDSGGTVVRIDRHETRVEIDNSQIMGRQYRPLETWSGAVRLGGDVSVPAGHSLVIEPGTVVEVAKDDALVYAWYPKYSQENTVNTTFGNRNEVDLFVEGFLDVNGADGSMVTFKSETITPARNSWGGIRVRRKADAYFDWAIIESAGVGIQGEYRFYGNSDLDSPDIRLRDSIIRDTGTAVSGVCTRQFDRTEVAKVEWVMKDAHCYDTLTFDSVYFHDIEGRQGNTDGLIQLYPYRVTLGAKTPLTVQFLNSYYDRGLSQRTGAAFFLDYNGSSDLYFGIVQIDNSTLTGLYWVSNLETSTEYEQVLITDSVVTNTTRVLPNNSGASNLDYAAMDNNVFYDMSTLLYTGYGSAFELAFTNNRVQDVNVPFSQLTWDSDIRIFNVTGNHFENATTVYDFGFRSDATDRDNFGNLAGNNYVNCTSVLFTNASYMLGCPVTNYCVSSSNADETLTLDMTNSYFGVATEGEIMTLLDEPYPVSGRTVDYTGFYTSARTDLTVPDLPNPLP